SGWDTLADQYGFAVAYPQQQSANNIESCFNWFDGATDDVRGAGEAESIDEMVQYEITTHGIDPSRVFITGFSSGAAMTSVMAATYPDVFAAASIMEGLPYACATTETDAFTCMNPGVTKTADQWGALVKAAYTATAFPRVQIWVGTADTTVAPMNAQQLALQWTDVAGVAMNPTGTGTVGSASWTDYGSAVEVFEVSGMDHAVALGDDGSIACPGTATTYFEDHGVCSTVRAAQFFGIVPAYATNGSGSGSGGNGNGSGSGSDNGGGGGGNGDNNGSGSAGTMLDAGGCNVGGNGAGALIVIAGVMLGLRRRRA
ncbi:MAG TPA: PHB depolymerase family esterase, partial [Kofleriaceae bacterium]